VCGRLARALIIAAEDFRRALISVWLRLHRISSEVRWEKIADGENIAGPEQDSRVAASMNLLAHELQKYFSDCCDQNLS
jgi:hypothetical protein